MHFIVTAVSPGVLLLPLLPPVAPPPLPSMKRKVAEAEAARALAPVLPVVDSEEEESNPRLTSELSCE